METKICPPNSLIIDRATIEQVVYTYAQENGSFSRSVTKLLEGWGYDETDSWKGFRETISKISDDQLIRFLDKF